MAGEEEKRRRGRYMVGLASGRVDSWKCETGRASSGL